MKVGPVAPPPPCAARRLAVPAADNGARGSSASAGPFECDGGGYRGRSGRQAVGDGGPITVYGQRVSRNRASPPPGALVPWMQSMGSVMEKLNNGVPSEREFAGWK